MHLLALLLSAAAVQEPTTLPSVDLRSAYDVHAYRLDLRIDKRFRFDTWFLEIYLDVQNVYNATNPESARYSFDYSIKSEGISVPILPTLGIHMAF